MVAIDVNASHLAAVVVDRSGNPAGVPCTVPLDPVGLAASVRDGRLRSAISELLRLVRRHGGRAVVVEDLDFADARDQGRERSGRRPQRGERARAFRRQVAGIPTGKFRRRLVEMATNTGLAVVAVDPAYTSRWGAQHWLGALQQQCSSGVTGHHAAAVSSADVGSDSEHGEGEGVTEPHERMGNVELPTWPCGPHRQALVCPARGPGNPGTARPEGSRTRGGGPERPTGHPGRPGGPGPFGAARQAGLTPAQ
jgi:IS605 OrfB family transposase